MSGCKYFEARIADEGISRVGWASVAASHDLGTDAHGYGFGGTGKKSHMRKFDSYGEPFTAGDVIGCFLQMPAAGKQGAVSFSKNGKWLGHAFDVPASMKGPLFPAISMKNAQLQVAFHGADMKHPPSSIEGAPGQYQAIGDAALDTLRAAPAKATPAVASSRPDKGAGGPIAPLVLILEPARDLAEQTSKAVEDLSKDLSAPAVRSGLLIGGSGKDPCAGLHRGLHVLTATLGSLIGMVKRGKISLSAVRLLVLDEADNFTDKEGLADIDAVWRAIHDGRPPALSLQVCFFSATLHSAEIQALGQQLCHHPTWVDLKGRDSVPDTVHHALVVVDPSTAPFAPWRDGGATSPCAGVPTDAVHAADQVQALASGAPHSPEAWSEAVKRLKPALLVDLIDSLDMSQVLVFCRTNLDCDNLQKYLVSRGGGRSTAVGKKMESGKENKYSCCVLAGARSQDERRAALAAFKEGDTRIMIATDVAARGIDVKELPYVVNMTLPDEPENYIHRIGRVGRAERMGLAISLVASCQEKVWFYDKRKWKGKKLSTALADQGGCCIWYDEPGLLAAVERRLQLTDAVSRKVAAAGGRAVHEGGRGKAVLSPSNCALPCMQLQRTGTAAAAGGGGAWRFELPAALAGAGEGGVVYGAERGVTGGTSEHVAAIAPTVEVLMGMEMAAQSAHLALAARFAGCAAGLQVTLPVRAVAAAAAGKQPARPPAAHSAAAASRAGAVAAAASSPPPPAPAAKQSKGGQHTGAGRGRGKKRGPKGASSPEVAAPPGKRGRGGHKGAAP